MRRTLRAGCSGWHYRHWRGAFYPQDARPAQWFAHYAATFDTVELNNSFYRLPSEQAIRSWSQEAPPAFCFALKASRLITHFRRLEGVATALGVFFERVRLLGEALGPILYQLPPDFERNDRRLDDFLSLLPPDLTHVFEFRHQSWWHSRVYERLEAAGAVFCMYDRGASSTPAVATAPDVYLRMHGPAGDYAGTYSDDALRRWVHRLSELRWQRAWVYFNNDGGAAAPRDAVRLRELWETGTTPRDPQ